MAIDHGAPEYVYRQVADELRERIRSGKYLPRTRIPPLTALTDEFEVSPVTARKAIRVLVDEGVLVIMPGRGTFVREQ